MEKVRAVSSLLMGLRGQCVYLRSLFALLALCLLGAGCAKAMTTTMKPCAGNEASFLLQNDVRASLESGGSVKLRNGTRWRPVGRIESGTVFAGDDQVLQVGGMHLREIRPVIANDQIAGFYFPVEQIYTPAKSPVYVKALHQQSTSEEQR